MMRHCFGSRKCAPGVVRVVEENSTENRELLFDRKSPIRRQGKHRRSNRLRETVTLSVSMTGFSR